jgi:hypothetical protein
MMLIIAVVVLYHLASCLFYPNRIMSQVNGIPEDLLVKRGLNIVE